MAALMRKRQATSFQATLSRIEDERVRYFYLMLGDAIGEFTTRRRTAPELSNTGPGQLADIARRIND